MLKTVHGKIHGRIIKLDEDLEAAEEGKEVDITVRMILLPVVHQPGLGLLRTEGALTDDTEWDEIMEDIYQARKQDRQRPLPQWEEA